MSKKSIVFIAILYVVICAVTIASIALLHNNSVSKKVNLCKELQDDMIYVTTYDGNFSDGTLKEKETIDLTKLSSLKLGERITLSFSDDIKVYIMNAYIIGGGYRGFIITGLVHDDLDFYYVIDNITVGYSTTAGVNPNI